LRGDCGDRILVLPLFSYRCKLFYKGNIVSRLSENKKAKSKVEVVKEDVKEETKALVLITKKQRVLVKQER